MKFATGESMSPDKNICTVDGVYFDFGGVLAEEGFRGGLKAIAEEHGLDPKAFFDLAVETIHHDGYLTGDNDETSFWRRLRLETGIQRTDEDLRREILSRFILREPMLAVVDGLKLAGVVTGILSDQTNWLEELDEKYGFMRHFDVVINSYRFGKSKYDGSIFEDAARDMGLPVERILFIDDTKQHVERAEARGMRVLHYDFPGFDEFLAALREFCPDLEVGQ
jgi:putative hydrolase of the HAD superfamily